MNMLMTAKQPRDTREKTEQIKLTLEASMKALADMTQPILGLDKHQLFKAGLVLLLERPDLRREAFARLEWFGSAAGPHGEDAVRKYLNLLAEAQLGGDVQGPAVDMAKAGAGIQRLAQESRKAEPARKNSKAS